MEKHTRPMHTVKFLHTYRSLGKGGEKRREISVKKSFSEGGFRFKGSCVHKGVLPFQICICAKGKRQDSAFNRSLD